MATQSDKWTKWSWWLDDGYPRNITHIGGQIEKFIGGGGFNNINYIHTYLQNAATGVDGAIGSGDIDSAILTLKWMFNAVSQGLQILMYASVDTRELMESVSMTKEEVFDLWLERAGEMVM